MALFGLEKITISGKARFEGDFGPVEHLFNTSAYPVNTIYKGSCIEDAVLDLDYKDVQESADEAIRKYFQLAETDKVEILEFSVDDIDRWDDEPYDWDLHNSDR